MYGKKKSERFWDEHDLRSILDLTWELKEILAKFAMSRSNILTADKRSDIDDSIFEIFLPISPILRSNTSSLDNRILFDGRELEIESLIIRALHKVSL